MKKLILASIFLLAGFTVLAQAGTGYFAILPGYQFSTGNYQYSQNFVYAGHVYEYRVYGSGQNNFTGSLDGGYFFTDNIGIHFAYVYNAGQFRLNGQLGPYYLGDFRFDQNISIAQVGPEFVMSHGSNSQTYFQVNVGYTFGNSTPNFHSAYGDIAMGDFGTQTFVYGGAVGYRYYFTDMTGLAVQVGYNHFQDYAISNFWDARIGVVFRFK